jgi:hypothetical protein
MDRFPPLPTANASLPMADYVAVALCEALLECDDARRTEALEALLRRDPPLLLWSIVRSGQWQDAPPDGIAEVAAWLSDCLLDVLRWPDEAFPGIAPKENAPTATARLGRLAGQRCSQAQAAQQFAAGDAGYLRAMLAGAGEWLADDVSASFQADQMAFPKWLAEFERLSPGQAIGISGEASDIGKAVERAWTSMPLEGRGGAMLRKLAGRLRRLRELETEFSAALEREKLDALKELAYGASHEINNPLANISTRAQTLLRDETDPERRKKLATINSQAFRAHEMIADMMLFARPPQLEPEPLDLQDVVSDVLAELAEDAAEQGTRLNFRAADQPPASLVIAADGGQLRVALKAVVQNSLEAIGVGGRVEIALQEPEPHNGRPHAGNLIRIVVTDTGPGLTPEVRRHLFDPFYCGREAGRGLGLGLSKAWRIVTAHGGRIEVESEPGRGATFALCLPHRPD